MENTSIEKLIEENKLLKEKINELTEHLKKYTAPKRNKKFYENHKEEIIKKVMEYKEKNKDVLKNLFVLVKICAQDSIQKTTSCWHLMCSRKCNLKLDCDIAN
jgi:hypothetical protein